MSTLLSAGLLGIEAYPIDVEVDFSRGLPGWSTVGLPENAVRESKDRVVSAIYNSGYEFPMRKITLNLAPADVKKSGTALDLPIALGLLDASSMPLSDALKKYLILGELSLTGKVRPIRGVLSIAILAKKMGLNGIIIPVENMWEAEPVEGIAVYGASDLPSVVEFFLSQKPLMTFRDLEKPLQTTKISPLDFAEVKGQAFAKRAMEVAAAGFHNFLLVGPPGTGKSMLASRLPGILPEMSFAERINTTKIYSLLGLLAPGESLVQQRPFRSPHHTISDAGLIGGGSNPRPGEVSLAHNGVLFLDELTEFKKNVLESLRQPLESHQVTIARAMQSLTYPARFLLAAAMNPCPCGQLGNPQATCLCPARSIQRYQNKLSGPLLDRIDLQVDVPPLNYLELRQNQLEEASEKIRQRTQAAKDRQTYRFKEKGIYSNSQMGPKQIREFCQLNDECEKLFELAIKKWKFSARAYHRILKVARTIADLEQSDQIETHHLNEAIGYRTLDKAPMQGI